MSVKCFFFLWVEACSRGKCGFLSFRFKTIPTPTFLYYIINFCSFKKCVVVFFRQLSERAFDLTMIIWCVLLLSTCHDIGFSHQQGLYCQCAIVLVSID